MKLKIALLAFLLLGTILPSNLIAQNPNPDLTRMRLLLARIADCNADIKEAQAELDAYVNLETEMSLEMYRQLKKNVAIATKCKETAQKEYDQLKADYEGWFNQSTSAMGVDGHRITPIWLRTYLGDMVTIYVVLFKAFAKIPEPEH